MATDDQPAAWSWEWLREEVELRLLRYAEERDWQKLRSHEQAEVAMAAFKMWLERRGIDPDA